MFRKTGRKDATKLSRAEGVLNTSCFCPSSLDISKEVGPGRRTALTVFTAHASSTLQQQKDAYDPLANKGMKGKKTKTQCIYIYMCVCVCFGRVHYRFLNLTLYSLVYLALLHVHLYFLYQSFSPSISREISSAMILQKTHEVGWREHKGY